MAEEHEQYIIIMIQAWWNKHIIDLTKVTYLFYISQLLALTCVYIPFVWLSITKEIVSGCFSL